MRGRYLLGGLALLFAVLAATMIVRCELVVSGFTSFSYVPHERPRVFVSHHPLRAVPGAAVTIRLVPDAGSDTGPVERAVARFGAAGSEPVEQDCAEHADDSFTCEFALPPGRGDFVYDAYVELQGGARATSLVSYEFTAAEAVGENDVVLLRKPVSRVEGLRQTSLVETVWVRDSTSPDAFDEEAFLAAVESAVYDGILADPVYRWRDSQLSFAYYGRPGFTSSYYSGFDTRCGQNPWPADAAFPAALAGLEVLGVLHRHPSSASGIEGTVEPAGDLPTVFRDCAGTAVKNGTVGTFSVTAGAAETARVAKHEFGHAAFGLGDEYAEATETRAAPAAVNPLDGIAGCCCLVPEDGPVGTGPGAGGVGAGVGIRGGARVLQCVAEGGGIETRPALGGSLPGECTGTFPPACGATPQAACPQLTGDCVQPRLWLADGAPSGRDTSRPNMFTSKAACEDGRALAAEHPGVEDRVASLGRCRKVCGPGLQDCPCNQAEGWIVDTNPAVRRSRQPPPDSMAVVRASRHGGTCAWCVETSLCVRWQLARGDTSEEAWQYCDAPPLNAADTERGIAGLVRYVGDFIREIGRHVRF